MTASVKSRTHRTPTAAHPAAAAPATSGRWTDLPSVESDHLSARDRTVLLYLDIPRSLRGKYGQHRASRHRGGSDAHQLIYVYLRDPQDRAQQATTLPSRV